jgi:guanine deaminase
MLVIGGQLLLASDDGSCRLETGVVEIDGERIVGVTPDRALRQVDIGDHDTLVSPGLIDAHLHLPQFDSMGVAGMRLLPWLENVIFPAEIRWNDPEFARGMIRRVQKQCLSVGTTGICAYATVNQQAALLALQAFQDRGFRGVIGQVMMDRHAPPELCRDAEVLAEEVAETLQRFPPQGRLAAAVTPRFAPACSEALLEAAGRLAAEYQAVVQTHLAETIRECDWVKQLFGGRDYVSVYENAGLLTERTILGHGIHLDDRDQVRLAEQQSGIVHCPTANAFLGSGMMDRSSHVAKGVPVLLGSDIGAGYERSMVRVAREMILTANRLAESSVTADTQAVNSVSAAVPTAAEAWHAMTAGNAAALGWSDAGRISQGTVADLLLIKPDLPWRSTRCPLSTLLFAWDDRWIRRVYLRGRLKLQSGFPASVP